MDGFYYTPVYEYRDRDTDRKSPVRSTLDRLDISLFFSDLRRCCWITTTETIPVVESITKPERASAQTDSWKKSIV